MKRITWSVLALLAALALAWLLLVHEGGCDRTPPDDDEPVPACKPTDKECLGAEPGDSAA